MKSDSRVTGAKNPSSRCFYTTSHGHRCRSLASKNSRYCPSHSQHELIDSDDLSAELSAAALSLSSPDDLHRVLTKVFVAILQDRISIKKAGMITSLARTLLRSYREITIYKKASREEADAAEADQRHRQFLLEQDFRCERLAREDAYRRAAAEQQAAAEKAAQSRAAAKAAKAERIAQKARAAEEQSEKTAGSHKQSPVAEINASPKPSFHDALVALVTKPTNPPQLPPPVVTPPPVQQDLNHFYPWDPTLPPGRQDPSKNIPPPDAEELHWREVSRRYPQGRRRR